MSYVSGDDDVGVSLYCRRDHVPVGLGNILPSRKIFRRYSDLDRSDRLNEGNMMTSQFHLFFGLRVPGNPTGDFLGNAWRTEGYKRLMTGEVQEPGVESVGFV